MSRERTLVCPFCPELIDTISGRTMVVCTTQCNEVSRAFEYARRRNNVLAVRLSYAGPLDEVPFSVQWKEVPLILFATSFGAYTRCARQFPLLRMMRARIFLSTDDPDFGIGLKILSSLGIPCGIAFAKNKINWEQVDDVMSYALYSKAKHASIEPFAYISRIYDHARDTDYSSVYFDDPRIFIHCDAKGNLALTESNLNDGVFIGKWPMDSDIIESSELYTRYIEDKRAHLKKLDACSFCPGFRICGGRFADQAGGTEGCKRFFSDCIDAADFHLSKKEDKLDQLWL
jgi:hypothetical protein